MSNQPTVETGHEYNRLLSDWQDRNEDAEAADVAALEAAEADAVAMAQQTIARIEERRAWRALEAHERETGG